MSKKQPLPTVTGDKPRYADDFVPRLNKFIGGTGVRNESHSYQHMASVLGALKNQDGQVSKEFAERNLSRLAQFGCITPSTVEPLLQALHPSPQNRSDRELGRLMYYLVQLALGDGYAGTPMPVPRNHNPMAPLPKAVDRFGPELLSLSWADLGDESSSYMRKQGGMRALAALAHASTTSRPDDLTYVGGMLVTLQSLLERIEQMYADSISTRTNPLISKKKKGVREFTGMMEMWALLRLALSAARVALSQGGITKIADKCFMGIGSPDPLCARHALAIGATVAKDARFTGAFIETVEPLLRHNLMRAKDTGLLFTNYNMHKPTTDFTGAPKAPPKVVREEQEKSLNLRCAHARMYLARGCASSLQSGHIAGDVKGSGVTFWTTLILMVVSDPSNQVALESIKVMFGAPTPHAENLKKRPSWLALPGQDLESLSAPKVFGASWHMVVGEADEAIPLLPVKPLHEALMGLPGTGTEPGLAPLQPEAPDAAKAQEKSGGGLSLFGLGTDLLSSDKSKEQQPVAPQHPASLFTHIVSRILHCIDSASPSLSVAGCRAAGVLLEARAWCTSLSNGYLLQTNNMAGIMRVLQKALTAVLVTNERSAPERCAAAQALLWAQLGPEDHAITTPSVLLKAASHGGLSVHNVVKALFADPWPEALMSHMMSTLMRRIRCHPTMAKGCFELANALAAAAPSRVTKDQLQVLWEAVPGASAIQAALALLSSPPPPITQPNITAPVEVKALAANEEAAYDGLRAFAAWWLGEHINSVSGVIAWKPPPKASVLMPFLLNQQHVIHEQQRKQKEKEKKEKEEEEKEAREKEEKFGLQQPEQQKPQPPPPPPPPQPSPQGEGTVSTHVEEQKDGGLGGSGDVAALDPLERMALAAVVHAPLLAAVLSHLQRALLTGRWELCTAASQALAKLAVRSPEPYRIQAYSALTAAVQMGSTVPFEGFDPLGVSAVVAPALEVLDAMYAGELVLQSHASNYGTDRKEWPKPALVSLQRRHDWLIAMITQRIGLVPKDSFFPLGKLSRQLLRPDLPEEKVKEGDDEDAEDIDEAKEEGDGKKKKKGMPERDPLYEYPEDYEGPEVDLLEKWQPGEGDSKLAKVNWGKLGAGNEEAPDEDDARPGTMLYAFNAAEEGEVSVEAGERIMVTMEMDDWLYIVTATGEQGLVPASYVRVEEATDLGSVETSSRKSGGRQAEEYEPYNIYDVSRYEEYEDESGAEGRGLDDFSSILNQAEAVKQQREREARLLERQHRTSDSESSSFSGALPRQASEADGSVGYRGREEEDEEEEIAHSEAPVEEAPPPSAMNYGSLARALYDFEAQDENEIGMREGEELEVQGPEDEGWYPVMRLADEQTGLVPASYIEPKPLF